MVFAMHLDSNEHTAAHGGHDVTDTSTLPQVSDNHHQIDDLTALESPMPERDLESPLFLLPPELLQHILSYFSAHELARVSSTCRVLAEHVANDLLWAKLVNSHLPFKIYDPGPFESFRSLYVAHHPCWFIPQNKIWFSDTEHTGSLILGRYDNRRGVIEAYRVVAERQRPSRQLQFWNWNPDVIIQPFHPRVGLWLDDPVLLLKDGPSGSTGRLRYLNGEMRMPMALESQNVFSSFSLCSVEIPPHAIVNPNKQWPPMTIPSDRRVYRGSDTYLPGLRQMPGTASQVSEAAFRLRRWPHFGVGTPFFTSESNETLSTYATLDSSLYTPTKEKPYQGIWVGDYSAHGSEFLLFLQRDYEGRPASPTTSSAASYGSVFNDSGESETETEDIIQQGSLEAIKLTGDPNVPRGEISFIAEDIGQDGLVRKADEPLFQGARIVHSRGHAAGLGFRDGKFQPLKRSSTCSDHLPRHLPHVAANSHLHRLRGALLGNHGPCVIFPPCGH